MSFTKVSELLLDFAKRSGDPDPMEAAYVIESVQNEIEEVYGMKAIGHVRAKSFRDGLLTIHVSSSVWADYARMYERKFKFHMSQVLKNVRIVKVRYEV